MSKAGYTSISQQLYLCYIEKGYWAIAAPIEIATFKGLILKSFHRI